MDKAKYKLVDGYAANGYTVIQTINGVKKTVYFSYKRDQAVAVMKQFKLGEKELQG
jgi:hypothetical protein